MRDNFPLIGKVPRGKGRMNKTDIYFSGLEQESYKQLLEICVREKFSYSVSYRYEEIISVKIIAEKI